VKRWRGWYSHVSAALVVAAAVAWPLAQVVEAATPSSGQLTAPSAIGSSVSTTWAGTVGPGTNQPTGGGGLRCFSSTANNATGSDPYTLKLLGTTASYYQTHSAKLVITVTYTPAISASANELSMTTAFDDGSGNLSNIMDSSQSAVGNTTLTVTYTNPPATTGKGFIYVGVCPARNLSSQDYSARATLTVGQAIHNYPGLYSSAEFGFHSTTLPDAGPVGTPLSTSRYGEPGIWINKHGYGIINTFGPVVWITTDDGKTWSAPWDLGNNNDAAASCPVGYDADSDAVVGPDNAFYADNLCVGPLPSNPQLVGPASQNDSFTNKSGGAPGANGANWAGPNYAGGDVDRQWYAVDPVQPGLVYMSYHDLEGPNINFLKSTDGGLTFTCPILGGTVPSCPVTATQNGNDPNSNFISTALGNTTGRPLVDPTNTQRIYVPYLDNVATGSATAPPTAGDPDLTRVRMAVSTDGGTTWSANTDPGGNPALDANVAFPYDGSNDNTLAHLFNTAAIDSAGNLYVLFSLRVGHAADVGTTHFSGTTTHLYLISSTNHGVTWSKPVQVDSGGIRSSVFQWIVAGDPGRVAITWYGSKADDFNDTSAQWSEMYAVSTNALSAQPTFTLANVSGVNPIHNGDICQAGIDCQVTGGNRDLSDFQMVTIDRCGNAHAVWTDDIGPGVTRTAAQTSGPKLYVTNACPATSPFTAGVGYPSASVAVGAAAAGAGALLLLLAGVLWRRRSN